MPPINVYCAVAPVGMYRTPYHMYRTPHHIYTVPHVPYTVPHAHIHRTVGVLRREREAAAAGRTDAKMKNVVISEKWDKKAAKFTAGSLPFPYDSKEVYESSIRQPLGREVSAGRGEGGGTGTEG